MLLCDQTTGQGLKGNCGQDLYLSLIFPFTKNSGVKKIPTDPWNPRYPKSKNEGFSAQTGSKGSGICSRGLLESS